MKRKKKPDLHKLVPTYTNMHSCRYMKINSQLINTKKNFFICEDTRTHTEIYICRRFKRLNCYQSTTQVKNNPLIHGQLRIGNIIHRTKQHHTNCIYAYQQYGLSSVSSTVILVAHIHRTIVCLCSVRTGLSLSVARCRPRSLRCSQ